MALEKLLKKIKDKERRIVVGIEAGYSVGSLAAALVEVTGYGDETLIDVRHCLSSSMPAELVSTLNALDRSDDFDSEDTAGINFLVLHQISNLYQSLLDQADCEPEEIDLVGLKCLETGSRVFPEDPAVLSEMAGVPVATHFSIRSEEGGDDPVRVDEHILQGMVDGIAKRFDLDREDREAVCVAVFANEALCSDSVGTGSSKEGAGGGNGDKAGLFGEFFFPA